MELTLREMDVKADRVIVNWSFAALAANLLPPPFDIMAVGTVLPKQEHDQQMVMKLRQLEKTVKDIGLATANHIGNVIGAVQLSDHKNIYKSKLFRNL